MKKFTENRAESRDERSRSAADSPQWETLEQFARTGVQQMIQRMLEEEVDELLGRKKSERRAPVETGDAVDVSEKHGTRTGYRNGYGKPRHLTMTSGTITVKRPRVRDLEERFVSRLLPLFKKSTEQVGALLPELYLHGLSLGDFDLALRGLLGDHAPLSANSIMRLKTAWQAEYATWNRRDLSKVEVVYLWVDGIYVKAGLEKEKAALLVVIGATADGEKVILAVESGHRESSESWATVLRTLKSRGLRCPKLTIGDGHLGIWSGLASVYPKSEEQRCWNHKLRNVLDAVPKKKQPAIKSELQAMAAAETQAECDALQRAFRKAHEGTHPKAVDKLESDWERMVTYYRFPSEHWKHIRTSNIVESPFAAVRLRTGAAKRFKKVENATALIWKMLRVVEQNFRKLNAPELMREIYDGIAYHDGKRVVDSPREQIAA